MSEAEVEMRPRHRRPDSKAVVAARLTGYAGMVVAGLVGAFIPPPALDNYLGHDGELAWSVYLIVGGLGAFVGILVGEWIGEFVFLTLLMCGVGLYGILVLLDSRAEPAKAVAGVLIMVLTSALFIRWLTVYGDARQEVLGHDNDPRG